MAYLLEVGVMGNFIWVNYLEEIPLLNNPKSWRQNFVQNVFFHQDEQKILPLQITYM